MGLFREPLEEIFRYRERARALGKVREFACSPFTLWPERRSLVLQEDTLVELGSSSGSLFLVLWTGDHREALHPGRISLIGPDVNEIDGGGMPFALIVLVRGQFEDEYETHRELRDAIFDTEPVGLSTRIWPARQKIWCRISREALAGGFSLFRYGCTLIKNLGGLQGVSGVEIIFATEAAAEWERQLHPVAEKVQGIVEALIKMYEEMNFDCEECEYNEVCAEVTTLREIRERLREERRLQ